MFPTQSILSSAVAYQKELQRQSQRKGLQAHYPGHKLYPVKRRKRKPVFLKLALPLADLMIQSGQQLKKRYQPT
ncbi:MAG: hypothetical protein MAG431_02543 [Chloroflexi bacterium]|nr:hypothetical protein [Chloroflexota bacterium]